MTLYVGTLLVSEIVHWAIVCAQPCLVGCGQHSIYQRRDLILGSVYGEDILEHQTGGGGLNDIRRALDVIVLSGCKRAARTQSGAQRTVFIGNQWEVQVLFETPGMVRSDAIRAHADHRNPCLFHLNETVAERYRLLCSQRGVIRGVEIHDGPQRLSLGQQRGQRHAGLRIDRRTRQIDTD